MKRPSIRSIRELVKKWQVILRLQDWHVDIAWGSFEAAQKNAALNEWCLQTKSAEIILVPHSQWPKGFLTRHQDYEWTITHELLHLHFAPLDTFQQTSPRGQALEVAIDSVAEGLIRLDRGEYEDP